MNDAQSGSLAAETIRSSSLYNKDLAPVSPERRTWGTYNYAALWISMSVNIPTYMLASGMIAGGMNWSQALFTVFLGNVLVLIPMLLNAHAGAQYGIPFPVRARVFEKFYRLDPSQTGGIGGTGLGLYIARELVTRMGGRIGLVPRERGATFYVDLPAAS